MTDYRERNGITGGVAPPAPPAPAPAKPAKPKGLAAAATNVNMMIVPVGRYWVTAFGTTETELDAYFKINAATGATQTEVTEHIGDPGTAAAKQGSFYIFNVKTPLGWPVGLFGKPTTAGPNIHSMADTVSAPDLPTGPVPALGNFLDDLGQLFSGTGGMIAAGVLIWLLTEGSKHHDD